MALQLRVSSLTKTTPSLLSSHNHNQSSISRAFLLSASLGVCKFASPSKSSTRSRQITTTRCLFGKGVVPAANDVVEGVLDGVTNSIRSISQPDRVKRDDFPLDFKFGASTSALQTEGSGSEGGRGPSTRDSFLHDFSVGGTETATNYYRKYKDDVKALKEMGMDAHRMSISWSRLFPKGSLSGGINQEGIDFYNKFFQKLFDNGIEPFATLFHLDLPTALQTQYRGFLDKKIVDDFKDFADLCFKNFGDKVKHWTTIEYGYRVSLSPTGDKVNDPYDDAHNIILSHAAAAKLYMAAQGGEIGISIVGQWFVPHSDSSRDKEAAERANDFMVGWDNLPMFTDKEKEMVKGSYDFIGVKYYTARYAKDIPFTREHKFTSTDKYQFVEQKEEKNGVPIGPLPPAGGSESIYIYLAGLRDVLVYMKERNENPKFYVTENGIPEGRDDSQPMEKALEYNHRIEVILSHLYALREAMKKGVNMKGFFIRALLDLTGL
ncbi:hypothetical protein MKX03_037717 [Papaver bracteatum]|nr:hypothetical protein MKX03_037717 [Papaver bracteatum]